MIVLAHLTRERDAGTTDRLADRHCSGRRPARYCRRGNRTGPVGPRRARSRPFTRQAHLHLWFFSPGLALEPTCRISPSWLRLVVASHYVARQRFSCPCVKTKEQESRRVTFEHSLPAQMMAIDGTLASFVYAFSPCKSAGLLKRFGVRPGRAGSSVYRPNRNKRSAGHRRSRAHSCRFGAPSCLRMQTETIPTPSHARLAKLSITGGSIGGAAIYCLAWV